MENAIYVGLSRSIALQRQMDTVANNIANLNTPGYRAQHMMFKEYVQNPKGIAEPLSMVEDYGQYMSNKPGVVKTTGNPLDVALSGPGFLSVAAGGETLYTRAGSLNRSANGELVTSDGRPVLSAGGGAINIPQNSTLITIAEDGTISNQEGAIGQLEVTEFDNINTLEAVGDSLYRATIPGNAAMETRVKQGMIEGSNVNAIAEMTRMIDVSRAYQSTQRMLQNEHERQTNMIQKMTRG